MTDGAQREMLSALLDDEASELEVRRVLRDLDAGDQATWSRWQLARDIMNGQRVGRVPEGFAAGVTAQLEPRSGVSPAWLSRVGRVAVAATVAAATVVGWQYYQGSPQGIGEAPAMAASQESRLNAPVGETALVSQGVGGVERAAEDRRRLDGMVLRHNDLSARHSGQGVAPYARLISLQARHGSR